MSYFITIYTIQKKITHFSRCSNALEMCRYIEKFSSYVYVVDVTAQKFLLSDICEFAITSRKGSKCYFIFPKRRNAARSRAFASVKLLFQPEATQPPVAAVPVIVLLHQETQSQRTIKTLQCEYFQWHAFSHLLRANYLQNRNALESIVNI